MLAAAESLGYEYVALTDHSQGLGVANGLTPERLAAQRQVLDGMQPRFKIRILAGSEVDIRADGRMDFPDDVLAGLDVVVASVHNAMAQDSADHDAAHHPGNGASGGDHHRPFIHPAAGAASAHGF